MPQQQKAFLFACWGGSSCSSTRRWFVNGKCWWWDLTVYYGFGFWCFSQRVMVYSDDTQHLCNVLFVSETILCHHAVWAEVDVVQLWTDLPSGYNLFILVYDRICYICRLASLKSCFLVLLWTRSKSQVEWESCFPVKVITIASATLHCIECQQLCNTV